jgi:hypothetical protein
MSWLYVPGLAVSNSESDLPSIFSERAAASSLQWRGKPQPPQAWSRRWKQGGFIRLLSGLTCEPSTADRGVTAFISSLPVIHARTTASPESGPDQKAIGFSLPKSAALPPSAGLRLSSEKTCLVMLMDNSPPSPLHWKHLATRLREEYSARPKLATPCGGSDCSSWPSARAEDSESSGRRVGREVSDTLTAVARDTVAHWPSLMAGSAGTENYNAAGNSDFSRKAMELIEQSEWMAPQVPNGGRSTAHAEKVGATLYHEGKKVQIGLEAQSKEWAAPQARDHFPPHSPERIAAMKAEGHGMRNLNDEAATWRAPSDISKRGGSQPAEKRQAGGHSVNLEDQAEYWNPTTWAAPAAQNHKGSSEGTWPGPQSRDWRSGESQKSDAELWGTKGLPLERVATQLFHPPSSPDQAIAGGAICSTDTPNTNQPSVKRRLNPIFVEALMRWPTGLSGFERPAMAWTQWQQLQRSYLSALFSGSSGGMEG